MKNLKRNILALFLLVGMSLIYQSCQKDQIIGNTSNVISNSNSTIKKVSFDELKAKVSLEKSLKLIEGKLDLNKSRDITSNDGSFTIMTDEILEASNGLYSSYTFRLKTPTDPLSTFENFVLYPNSNNSFDYYLYKFKYNSNLPKEFPYDVSYFLVDANQIDTENFNNLKTMGYYIDNSGCLMYGYMICLVDADCFIATPITVWCPGGGGGSSSSGDSGTTGGSGSSGPTGTNTGVEGGTGGSTGYSGGGGVGTSNSGSNQTVSTTPIALNIPYTETVLQALSLTNNLTSEIQAWIENPVNYLNVKKLATFLTTNNSSPEAVGFVSLALNNISVISSLSNENGNLVLNLNNGDSIIFNPQINATNSIIFNNSLEEIINYLRINNTSPTEMFTIDVPQNLNRKVGLFKWDFFTTTLNFYIGQNIDPNGSLNNYANYEVTDLSTALTGTTIAQQYENITYNVTKIPNLNKARVDSYGVFSYFIFWEGIGTVYRQALHFQMDLKMSNGDVLFGIKFYN